jgi:hypothetical protein
MKRSSSDLIHFKSGNQFGAIVGAEHVKRLTTYIERVASAGCGLPSKNGRVNNSAVALACGFNRSVLYQNPAARELLQETVTKLGLKAMVIHPKVVPVDTRDQEILKLQQDKLKLEQENANLKAEVFALRRANRKLEHIEALMVETGRRTAR